MAGRTNRQAPGLFRESNWRVARVAPFKTVPWEGACSMKYWSGYFCGVFAAVAFFASGTQSSTNMVYDLGHGEVKRLLESQTLNQDSTMRQLKAAFETFSNNLGTQINNLRPTTIDPLYRSRSLHQANELRVDVLQRLACKGDLHWSKDFLVVPKDLYTMRDTFRRLALDGAATTLFEESQKANNIFYRIYTALYGPSLQARRLSSIDTVRRQLQTIAGDYESLFATINHYLQVSGIGSTWEYSSTTCSKLYPWLHSPSSLTLKDQYEFDRHVNNAFVGQLGLSDADLAAMPPTTVNILGKNFLEQLLKSLIELQKDLHILTKDEPPTLEFPPGIQATNRFLQQSSMLISKLLGVPTTCLRDMTLIDDEHLVLLTSGMHANVYKSFLSLRVDKNETSLSEFQRHWDLFWHVMSLSLQGDRSKSDLSNIYLYDHAKRILAAILGLFDETIQFDKNILVDAMSSIDDTLASIMANISNIRGLIPPSPEESLFSGNDPDFGSKLNAYKWAVVDTFELQRQLQILSRFCGDESLRARLATMALPSVDDIESARTLYQTALETTERISQRFFHVFGPNLEVLKQWPLYQECLRNILEKLKCVKESFEILVRLQGQLVDIARQTQHPTNVEPPPALGASSGEIKGNNPPLPQNPVDDLSSSLLSSLVPGENPLLSSTFFEANSSELSSDPALSPSGSNPAGVGVEEGPSSDAAKTRGSRIPVATAAISALALIAVGMAVLFIRRSRGTQAYALNDEERPEQSVP